MFRSFVRNFAIITVESGRAMYFLIVGIYIYPLLDILVVNAPNSLGIMVSIGNLTGVFAIVIALGMLFTELCFLCVSRTPPKEELADAKGKTYGATDAR